MHCWHAMLYISVSAEVQDQRPLCLLLFYQAMVFVSGQSESTNASSESKLPGATETSDSAAVGDTENNKAGAIEPSGYATMVGGFSTIWNDSSIGSQTETQAGINQKVLQVLDRVAGNIHPKLSLDDVNEITEMRDTLRAEHRFRGEAAAEHWAKIDRIRSKITMTEKKRKLDTCTQAPQTEMQTHEPRGEDMYDRLRGQSASPSSQCSRDMIDTTITNMAGYATRIALPII